MSKAWVLKNVGEIVFSDVEIPMPKEDEVRVRVKAAGICGSDIPRIYETGAHNMPLIPGHEFSGVVESIGKKVSPSWLGKRVAVFPKIACGKCRECQDELPDMCQNYDYIGSRRDGAFAEYVTAPAGNLIALPDSVSFEEAAMLEPMAVAANAMRMGCFGMNTILTLDKPVAVCGLGTIGLMVVMLLKDAGFKNIYVVGNKESQMKKVKSLGVSEKNFCDSRKENVSEWLKEKSDGGIVSYFECVGKNECITYGIEAAAPGGWIILVGNPYSDMTFSRDIWWQLLRKQMSVYGIWNSSFRQEPYDDVKMDDWNYVLKRIKEGRIKPSKLISHRLELKELETGLLIMRDKTDDYCKVMIDTDGTN